MDGLRWICISILIAGCSSKSTETTDTTENTVPVESNVEVIEEPKIDVSSVVLPDDYLTHEEPDQFPKTVEFDAKTWHYVGVAKRSGITLDKLVPIMFTAGDRDTRLVIAYAAEGQDYFNEIRYIQKRVVDKYGETRWVRHGLEETLLLDGSREVGTNVDGKLEGITRSWYPNGNIKKEWTYHNGESNGLHRGWWKNGNKQYESVYKNGKEVSGTAYDEDGNAR